MTGIRQTVEALCERYGTSDPYELCAAMDILVERVELSARVRGICYTDANGMAIGIDASVPARTAQFVCGHELGHLVLHRGFNSVFMETRTLLSDKWMEREANVFALYLLYPSDAEFLALGDTLARLVQMTGLSEPLVRLRLAQVDALRRPGA